MKVYEFSAGSNHHQDLMVDDRKCKTDKEFLLYNSLMKFRGEPKGKKWKAPPVFSLYPKRPIPDIWDIGVASGAFAVNQKAKSKLAMFLEMAGELFPLPYKDYDLTLCNITECVDCLDPDTSEYRINGKAKLLTKLSFYQDCLPESTLFKIPQLPLSIYCWENTGDPESEFKACVERNKFKGGFKGSFFELVWEAEE